MPKSREKERDKVKDKEKDKEKDVKGREPKKSHRALVSRVKKVVKKSRRKLGDEKFEKELQRTITFLARLQGKLGLTEKTETKRPARRANAPRPRSKASTKAGAKSAPRTRRTPARKS